MESYIARISQFESHLAPESGPVICLTEFKDLCFGGIPDKPGLRQICWKSFVKDLIVEPELEEPNGSPNFDDESNTKNDSEWSLFQQDNKTLEQIDKDVRRTLPDFAFFQLPVPYSALCPLSIEPRRLKPMPKKKEKEEKEWSPKKRSLPIAINPSNGSTATQSEPATILGSGSTGSLPGHGFSQRQRTMHGSSMDLKRASITRTFTPTVKRRQTVTVMSPIALKIEERRNDYDGDTDLSSWSSPAIFSSSPGENGMETPLSSYSNGFKTPTNNPVAFASPIPSRLRGMTTMLADIDGEDQPDEEDVEEEDVAALPGYLFSPIPTRRSLFKRVAHLNQDFGSRQHQAHSLQTAKSKDSSSKKKSNLDGSEVVKHKTSIPSTSSEQGSDEEEEEDSDCSEQDELPQDLHWEAIERILFIYTKLNPGVGYVQGMNEILGPLYYLLANDPDEVSRAHAEAESFWLFHLLMAHFRDHFVRSLDRDRTSGIGSTIARMNFRLRQFDEYLWQNLENKGIAPEYYSFRWLTVLCTQEFEVPDVWRIWDSVLADTGGVEKDYDFLLDFGCAMVCHLRHDLLEGDFADNVKLLQNYPPIDIQPILYLATVIRDHRVNGPQRSLVTSDSDSKVNTSQRQGIDLRLWNSKSSSTAEQQRNRSFSTDVSSLYYQDPKALTIDGVQNSDRLDHNLEGTDHRRSPLYTPLSAPVKRDRPPSISGLSLDGHWVRGNDGNQGGGVDRGPLSSSALDGRRQSSPSSLSVDNYAMGRDVRPQTATWAEAFTLFKARIVGLGSATGAGSSSESISNCDDGGGSRKTQLAVLEEAVSALSPSVEL
ncbi:hypothetical protein BGZ98_003246 [Dissophora globulifera]|nr:hypothetical protein BGZ98_003246 [Dissophora globulifera]